MHYNSLVVKREGFQLSGLIMKARIQNDTRFLFLFGEDNRIIKSEKLSDSGSTEIALAKLMTFATKKGIRVLR